MRGKSKKKKPIEAYQLGRWRLLSEYQRHLNDAFTGSTLHPTWEDPQRRLLITEYTSLFLLGIFNPIITSMRGLCQASRLEKVQEVASKRAVSIGSFSEAQHVLDPALLKKVYESLAREVASRRKPAANASEAQIPNLTIVDSTLWYALPDMEWAVWRKQYITQKAFRLHVQFNVLDNMPTELSIKEGRRCERKEWEAMAKPGEIYVGDRYYGEDYRLFRRLDERGCSFVVRLRSDAQWVEEEELVVDAATRQKGVIGHSWVRLGKEGLGPRVRVVRVLADDEQILIATNLSVEGMSAEWVSLCYRQRWQVELFFRWLKHIMKADHWMAQSQAGVAIQIYLTLIAAQLLLLFSGQRPNKRSMELLQFMVMGWATPEEVVALLKKAATKQKRAS